MFCPAGFDQWLTTIMQHLSHLSKPQATVLALWSFGMVLARSCALTAVRAHERASTMPKLHRANTVAWGLLRWDRCCMIVVSHWSKPAWQNMASLLSVVGSGIPHSMPQGGKSYHLI